MLSAMIIVRRKGWSRDSDGGHKDDYGADEIKDKNTSLSNKKVEHHYSKNNKKYDLEETPFEKINENTWEPKATSQTGSFQEDCEAS